MEPAQFNEGVWGLHTREQDHGKSKISDEFEGRMITQSTGGGWSSIFGFLLTPRVYLRC